MKLHWHPMPDGTIIVRAKNRSILDVGQSLVPPKGKTLKIAQMNAWQ
jgi:antitoxin PrlF